jgi:hypothetical protein
MRAVGEQCQPCCPLTRKGEAANAAALPSATHLGSSSCRKALACVVRSHLSARVAEAMAMQFFSVLSEQEFNPDRHVEKVLGMIFFLN